MSDYWLRHLMAAYIASEEIKGHSMRSEDSAAADERIRRQFTPIVENSYAIVDLMIEVGDRRLSTGQ